MGVRKTTQHLKTCPRRLQAVVFKALNLELVPAAAPTHRAQQTRRSLSRCTLLHGVCGLVSVIPHPLVPENPKTTG